MIGNILRAEIKNRNQVLKKCILLLAVMYAVVTMFLIAEESILQHELRETYDRYGEWMAVILDGNEELAASLEDDYPEVRFGRLAVLADVFYNDECIGRLGMADDVMVELGHPHLMEGRWPENDSQIVVTEHLLSGQGQKAATGDVLELSCYQEDTGSYTTEKYTVVGIMEQWGEEWSVDPSYFPQILRGKGEKESPVGTALAFSIYLDDSGCKDSITDSLIARLKEENSGTYVANDAAYSKDEGLKEKFFLSGSYLIAALLISCILIGYALNVFADKIGYKIRILRGLGASRKQMLLLALAESILVILTDYCWDAQPEAQAELSWFSFAGLCCKGT